MLDGKSAADIRSGIAEVLPDVDVDELLLLARQAFRDAGAEDEQTVRGWCLSASRHVYAKLLGAGDYSGAMAAIKVIDSIAKRSAGAKADMKHANEIDI